MMWVRIFWEVVGVARPMGRGWGSWGVSGRGARDVCDGPARQWSRRNDEVDVSGHRHYSVSVQRLTSDRGACPERADASSPAPCIGRYTGAVAIWELLNYEIARLRSYAITGVAKRQVAGVSECKIGQSAYLLLRRLALGGVECGVELVISDAHPGLKNTITTLFAGAGWQHCCTHHRQ